MSLAPQPKGTIFGAPLVYPEKIVWVYARTEQKVRRRFIAESPKTERPQAYEPKEFVLYADGYKHPQGQRLYWLGYTRKGVLKGVYGTSLLEIAEQTCHEHETEDDGEQLVVFVAVPKGVSLSFDPTALSPRILKPFVPGTVPLTAAEKERRRAKKERRRERKRVEAELRALNAAAAEKEKSIQRAICPRPIAPVYLEDVAQQIAEALVAAVSQLEYCNYGDSYEREPAMEKGGTRDQVWAALAVLRRLVDCGSLQPIGMLNDV